MIKTVLFVHGTGVRRAAYIQTCAAIAAALQALKLDVKLRPCAWGDEHGAEFESNGGLSIPDYEGPSAKTELSGDELVALWKLLAHDPLFELRERAAMASDDFVPAVERVRKAAYADALGQLAANRQIFGMLSPQVLPLHWQQAVEAVLACTPYQESLRKAGAVDAALRTVVARAMVASLQQALHDGNLPQITEFAREQLVATCLNAAGGHGLALVPNWVTERLLGLGLRWATNAAKRRRDALYNAAYPAAGDILLYQARGDAVRSFIAERVNECDGEVALLAHSLGGIACVDLLVERHLPQVKLLLTVGSQAPLLYEIDALTMLRRGHRLPDTFPRRWLNFYDPNDLLSYRAAPVFNPIATDHKIVSGQPFPYAHSAYWAMQPLWDKLQAALAQ